MVNILVVEDERVIAGLLVEVLEVEGYQTVSVANGEEAVQYALREVPHLIILDIMLPGIDGYEVIRRLRMHPKSMHIPIVILSAYCSSTAKAHAYEVGVDGFIAKPFNTEELLACIGRQLCRAQQNFLSPLTRLPGGIQVERAIDYKINGVEPWSVLYLDLDNFKSFNDVYGFLAGNSMITLLGYICQRVVQEYGNTDDFVGHIGGDDFVVITTPDRAKTLCRHILARYKEESSRLYRSEDRERGTISGLDRKGRAFQFPLVSLSVGIVSSHFHYPQSVEEVGFLAAEAKRRAKQSSDNVCYLASQQRSPFQDYSHAFPSLKSFSNVQAHLAQADYPCRERPLLRQDVMAEFK